MHCILSEAEVDEIFLASPPLISEQIYNFTLKTPRWTRDLYQVEEFPLGAGTEEQQLIVRGEMPAIERGFSKWKKLSNNSGCDPCEGPDCGYTWTQFGGNGIERKKMELMTRDFTSPSYCVKQIETTAHYQQMFGQVVTNLFNQTDFFKEFNIGQNYLTELAKKFVVDSDGPKPNTQNPYAYRPIGTKRISMLNIELLESFYEYLSRMTDVVPYDVINGAPIFALECSRQLLGRLYRDDPNLRQDVRFSGLANDLVTKYNFMSTIRGMFLAAPIMYPRRFQITAVTGEPVEVLPFVKGIPMELGSYTGVNPDYINPSIATHEEVLLHGKWPFKVKFLPTATSLGQGSDFGPEFSFMNSWSWFNPATETDPMRRVGRFISSATIGLAPQYSEGIFGVLVERASVQLTAMWLPTPACPPVPQDCDNSVPAVECPCPLILSAAVNPINGNVVLTLAVPLVPVPAPDDEIQFGIDTGGYLVGTVVEAASDGSAVEVTFPDGTDLGLCDHFTTIFCDNTMGCTANVDSYEINCLDATRLDLILSNPIKADTNGDVITIYYGDGTSASVTVISVDMSTLKWIVDVGATNFCDQVGGVISVCVPTATDATCPGCGGPSFTQCST